MSPYHVTAFLVDQALLLILICWYHLHQTPSNAEVPLSEGADQVTELEFFDNT